MKIADISPGILIENVNKQIYEIGEISYTVNSVIAYPYGFNGEELWLVEDDLQHFKLHEGKINQ